MNIQKKGSVKVIQLTLIHSQQLVLDLSIYTMLHKPCML